MADGFFGRLSPILTGVGGSLLAGGNLDQAGPLIAQAQQAQGQQQLRALQTRQVEAQLAAQQRKQAQDEATRQAFAGLPGGLFGAGPQGEAIRTAAANDPGLMRTLLAQRAKSLQTAVETPAQRATRELAEARTAKVQEETARLGQPGQGITDPVKRAGVESKLRSDFFTRSRPFLTQRDAAERLSSIAALPANDLKTGAQDLGIVFSFMKTLDPGSVVREGEFATAQNTAGVPGRIRTLYNQVLEGKILGAKQRQEFVTTANAAIAKAQKRHDRRIKRFTGIARRSGVDPQNVVTSDVTPPVPVAGATPPPVVTPTPAPSAAVVQPGIPGAVPSPSGPAQAAFPTQADAIAAFNAGTIKPGDRIMIGGQLMTVEP